MTQMEMAKEIAKKTKVHFGDVCDVIECYENLLMRVIATEDYYQIGDVGVLYGMTKWPIKNEAPVYNWQQKEKREKKKNWTYAKKGYPKMEFTRDAKMCLTMTAEEFFSEPPLKYCSAAREFRKSNGLPEIPEFDGLPEERVQKYCQEIDEQVMPKYEFKTPRDIEKMKAIQKVNPKEQKKRELYDEWIVEDDKQKQREAGIPEDEIVERSADEIKRERQYIEWTEGAKRITGNPDATIVEEKPEWWDEWAAQQYAEAPYHYTEEEKVEMRQYLDRTMRKNMRPKYGKKVIGKDYNFG